MLRLAGMSLSTASDLLELMSTFVRRGAAADSSSCEEFLRRAIRPGQILPWLLSAGRELVAGRRLAQGSPFSCLEYMYYHACVCQRLLSGGSPLAAAMLHVQQYVDASLLPNQENLIQQLLLNVKLASEAVLPLKYDAALQRRGSSGNGSGRADCSSGGGNGQSSAGSGLTVRWVHLSMALGALCSRCLFRQHNTRMAAPAQAALVRRLAEQLLEQLPVAPPPGISGNEWLCVWQGALKLAEACMGIREGWQRPLGPEQAAECDAAAAAARRVVPRAVAALRAAAALPGAPTISPDRQQWLPWRRLLCRSSLFTGGGDRRLSLDTAEQVAAALAAADSIAGLLPLAKQQQQQQQQPATGAEAPARSHAAHVGSECLDVLDCTTNAIAAAYGVEGGRYDKPAARQPTGSTADVAAAAAAAHHLVHTCCSLLIWAASGSVRDWLASLPQSPPEGGAAAAAAIFDQFLSLNTALLLPMSVHRSGEPPAGVLDQHDRQVGFSLVSNAGF
ncbi:hypothetical protein ABPG75_008509 [Micractinium tetrahymenae]